MNVLTIVMHMVRPGIDLGVAVGGGRYGGTYRGTRHDSRFGETEIAGRVAAHAAVVANLQYRQWFAEGTRFWYVPVTVGIRLF